MILIQNGVSTTKENYQLKALEKTIQIPIRIDTDMGAISKLIQLQLSPQTNLNNRLLKFVGPVFLFSTMLIKFHNSIEEI